MSVKDQIFEQYLWHLFDLIRNLRPTVHQSAKMAFNELDFENPDFDVTECINKQFPNEQSLVNIEDQIANIREKIKRHDEEISLAVRGQTIIEQDNRNELDKATTIIGELMKRIHDMKTQAEGSEQTVNEITCDIKQLDIAKRNLTSTVTMLNNLHILVGSIEKLEEIYNKNEYRQTASILAGIQDVMTQFTEYKHIPQINHLSSEIDRLCSNITEKIDFDFKRIFEVPSAKQSLGKEDAKLIAEACLVVSLLGGNTQEKLIQWFLNLTLTEYKALFKDSQLQTSSLRAVDKRYAWLKKHLLEFEDKYGFIFPPPWHMSERMAVEFCALTRESLANIMKANVDEVKLDPLMFAMSKTTAFEALLAKRFTGESIPADENVTKVHPFDGLISACFDPYFHVLIESQESSIQKLFEQFVDEHQKIAKSTGSKEPSVVYSSSNKLFQQYKSSLVQIVQLTNKSPLLDLHEVFKKFLRAYAFKVLQLHLKSPSSNSSMPLNKMVPDTTSGNKMFSVATYGAAGLLQSLLRDDTARNKLEPNQACSVILTADYCFETTQQLEKKIKERIDPTLECKVDLSAELDIFNELINGCIQLLIQHIEFTCEPAFTTMVKTQWSTIGTPVKPSSFIDDIIDSLRHQFPVIREFLRDGRKYFVQFCNKFITLFTHKYITNLFRCRLCSQNSAEQLLLDTQTLKKCLLGLPCYNSEIKTAPSSYIKAAEKGMSKAEMILKIILVPHNQVDNFIESYFKLLPDSNTVEFQRILEVKGVKRNETSQLIEAYNRYSVDDKKDLCK